MAAPLDERIIDQVIATDLAMQALCELLRDAQPGLAMKFAEQLRVASLKPGAVATGASESLGIYADALTGSAMGKPLQ